MDELSKLAGWRASRGERGHDHGIQGTPHLLMPIQGKDRARQGEAAGRQAGQTGRARARLASETRHVWELIY